MAGGAGSMALPRLQEDLRALQLHRVPAASWRALHEEGEPPADLDLGDAGAPSQEALKAVLRSLHAVREERAGPALWEWLEEPSGPEAGALPRLRALLVAVAKPAGGPPLSMQALAGTVYLTLLSVDGAAGRPWPTLYQPLVLQRVLWALRPLRAERRERALEKKDSASDPPRAAEPPGEADGACAEDAPQADAAELLGSLVELLEVGPLGEARDAAAMVIDALATLCAFPVGEAVAQAAATGLAALVASAGGPQGVRRTACSVLRALLPAVLMTQDRATLALPSIPRAVLQSRLVALGLARQIVQSHPELLVPCSAGPDADEAASEDDAAGQGEDGGVIVAAHAPRPKRHRRFEKGEDDPILSLVQLLCVSSPERAEFRALAAEAVLALLGDAAAKRRQQRPEAGGAASRATDVVGRFFEFLEQLVGCERASYRTLAVEVSSLMLERGSALVAGNAQERAELDGWLLGLLVRHCADAAPGVRCRALGGVAAALEVLPAYPEGLGVLRASLAPPARAGRLDLPGLFRAAATDEKAWVRRAALGLLEKWLRAPALARGPGHAEGLPLELLGHLANDDSVLVRRAAVSGLSALLRAGASPEACRLWAEGVLPLAADPEASVVERALEEIDAAVLAPLAQLGEGGGEGGEVTPRLPPVLQALDADLTEHLQRAVQSCAARKRGALLPPLARALAAVVREGLSLREGPAWPAAAWALLEELAADGAAGLLEEQGALPELVADAWERLQAAPGGESEGAARPAARGAQVLGVLEHLAGRLPPARAEGLARGLCGRVAALGVPLEQVRAALRVIGRLEDSGSARGTDVGAWRAQLLREVEASLAEQARSGSGAGGCEALFLLGELALAHRADLAHSTVAALQSIATSAGLAPDVRAHAFAALGKVCLRQESLAKRSVELFALHLGEQHPFAVRNNVLVVLADLCVQYTSLVDRFVLCMADLLRDANELLRRQSAMTLASLLSENFVKFRGPLVHRFLFALGDPAGPIRGLVECIFAKILHRRNPALFVQNFTDAVCALNGWAEHPSYQGAVGNERFALAAEPRRRVAVYRFMLSLMTHEQKFNVCSQLVTGFLAPFADAEDGLRLELPATEAEPKGQALGDVLALLGCKEMRVCFSPKLVDQEAEAAEIEGAGAAPGAAPGVGAETVQGALSGLMKQVVRENIVPVLLQIKESMEQQRSPFLGRLRRCLCEMLREFKDDLRGMLGDARLAEEVAFDLGVGRGRRPPAGGAEPAAEAPGPAPAEAAGGRGARPGGLGRLRRRAPSLGTALLPAELGAADGEDGEEEPAGGGECAEGEVRAATRGAPCPAAAAEAAAAEEPEGPAESVALAAPPAPGRPSRRRPRRAPSEEPAPPEPQEAPAAAPRPAAAPCAAEPEPAPPRPKRARQVATPQSPASRSAAAAAARRSAGADLACAAVGIDGAKRGARRAEAAPSPRMGLLAFVEMHTPREQRAR